MVKKRSEPAQRPPSEKGSPLDAKKGQREGRGACSVIPVGREGIFQGNVLIMLCFVEGGKKVYIEPVL